LLDYDPTDDQAEVMIQNVVSYIDSIVLITKDIANEHYNRIEDKKFTIVNLLQKFILLESIDTVLNNIRYGNRPVFIPILKVKA
jgi:hypothetical protein